MRNIGSSSLGHSFRLANALNVVNGNLSSVPQAAYRSFCSYGLIAYCVIQHRSCNRNFGVNAEEETDVAAPTSDVVRRRFFKFSKIVFIISLPCILFAAAAATTVSVIGISCFAC